MYPEVDSPSAFDCRQEVWYCNPVHPLQQQPPPQNYVPYNNGGVMRVSNTNISSKYVSINNYSST